RLILVPAPSPEVESQGFVGNELVIGGEPRPKGRGIIRLPNNPAAPIGRLTMIIDLEQAADIPATVRINGQPVLDDVASRSGDRSDWTRTVDVPDLGKETWLSIAIASHAPGVPGEARPLRLRFLSVQR